MVRKSSQSYDKPVQTGGKRQKDPPFIVPAISIITVVFNNASGIEKTIQSILGQSFKNFEYVIIDGGSSDGTLDVIRKHKEEIDFWLSGPDEGIYDAMNKGIKNARGNYLWFVNSGDLIESSDVLAKIPWNMNADIYYGETNLINDSGEVLGTRTDLTTRKLPKQMTWKDMKKGMVVSHQSLIVKKEKAPFYNTEYKYSSDIDWVINCLKNSSDIINVSFVLSRYLIGGFSIKNHRRSLVERFMIYTRHYGILSTLLAHISIAINAIRHALSGRKNY